ncbi:TetR/AcrR family transcriptional regulator, partial [Mycolicibacterium elephantis]|uniref:TetR/AcrR family transcriptional regulator n=1 Tax=Mycolicibacterium elephantis TaxID=81858 RepID=UPI001F3DCEDC
MSDSQSVPVPDDDVDPRRIRSRTRLLDAAATLLSTGGVEAVTIDAVTKASKVARTTLYRHFHSSSHLLAATFERLLPPHRCSEALQQHPAAGCVTGCAEG